MLYHHTPKPEVHERIPVDQVDILKFEPLVHKIVKGYAKSYGPIVSDHYEDYVSTGMIALLKAKESYDPTRGTFVTIAFRKVFSAIQRMFGKYSKQYKAADLRKLDPSSTESDACCDSGAFVDMMVGTHVDYYAIAQLLSPQMKPLFVMLFEGKTKGKICRDLGIPWSRYSDYEALLKDELHEIINTLYGG